MGRSTVFFFGKSKKSELDESNKQTKHQEKTTCAYNTTDGSMRIIFLFAGCHSRRVLTLELDTVYEEHKICRVGGVLG